MSVLLVEVFVVERPPEPLLVQPGGFLVCARSSRERFGIFTEYDS